MIVADLDIDSGEEIRFRDSETETETKTTEKPSAKPKWKENANSKNYQKVLYKVEKIGSIRSSSTQPYIMFRVEFGEKYLL